MSRVPLALLLLLAACDRSPVQTPPVGRNDSGAQLESAQNPPINSPAPGQPGGLPDDRMPVAEGPFAETSPQGAASVLERYFALVEQRHYPDAWRLWSDAGRGSGKSEADFATDFGRYREYHANIGAPGDAEGAAGSIYVEVPVQVYGRLADGEAFNATGTATLRRVNDVPGSTAEQRRWHIHAIDVTPPR